MEYLVTTFYKFTPLPEKELSNIKQTLETQAESLGVIGLTLIAPEGINATIAGPPDALATYKTFLENQFGALQFKDSPSDRQPFRRFKVKIKEEIVQLKRTDIRPTGSEPHLSPEEWDAMLESEDSVVIDVRNWYETKLGTFKKAIDPKTWKFSQFPQWLKKSDIPKDKKVMIFCTGGIRCEKAAVAMKEEGYDQVYQLDGGVLNYIEKRPNKNFEGECFVFDHRTSVTQELTPSQVIARCPHCGNGGELRLSCLNCSTEYACCDNCQPAKLQVCSKNCAYIYTRDHATEGARK
ncbi:MAG: rhodanese-like domain-containing protein [Candidatus Andersenbacteria bacterium]